MYYKLFDKQTQSDLHSGYNSESLEELVDAYLSYKANDWDYELTEIHYRGLPNDIILRMIVEDDFCIVSSETKFEEYE
jgi:hypothetical protein